MLNIPAPFPCVGSIAYARRSAEPRRILRHNADGTCLVQRLPRPGHIAPRDATANRTEPLTDLFDCAEEAALHNTPRPSRRARSGRAQHGKPAPQKETA